MKKIKIDFSDFWSVLNKTDNYFFNLLKEEFEVEISNNPDYLFFSVFGNNHFRYRCKKIFYTGENIAPDMKYCDWAFSFDYSDDPRNYRLPHYLLYDGYYELANKKVDESLVNRKFCSFLVTNGNCGERNRFFEELSKHKRVDSGGLWMNNIGYKVSDRREFQSKYKFSIAFENNAYRPGDRIGYTTEKITEPMTVNSIPIYRGNTAIGLEFNTKSFINCHDFESNQDIIDYVIDLDKDDGKYMEVLKQPWYFEIPEGNRLENIKSFLYGIFQ